MPNAKYQRSEPGNLFNINYCHMKQLLLLFLLAVSVAVCGQELTKTMESRAREMVRVIGLNDKEAWKKFIRENYTKALIEKPMQSKRQTSGDSGESSSSSTEEGNIEGKAGMYQMLHNDFGGGKITSLKYEGEKLTMLVSGSSGMVGTFTLKFTKEKPYLIDGLGVEVGN